MDEKQTPKNRYQFSVTAGQTLFHIRSYQNQWCVEENFTQLPHRHFSTELHYVFSGSEIIHYGPQNKVVNLQEGECCLIPKDCYHEVYIPESVLRLCFNWSIEDIPASGAPLPKEHRHIRELYGLIRTTLVIRDKGLTQLMDQYRMLPEPNGELASMEKGVMLLHIILHTLNLVSGGAANPSSRKNRNPCSDSNRRWLIEEYIADNCMHTGGLKELAKMLYLSERQTRTLVWKTLGKNYKDLIIQQRMELANFLLKDFSQTLEDISLKVGYRSYSGFYLAYTKYYGISPDAERQKYKC